MSTRLAQPLKSLGNPIHRPRAELRALTGLRFLAAAHVVLFHFYKPPMVESAAWLRPLIASGPASVSLFFVLSGFILTFTYADELSGGQFDARAFFSARFARVYPVYLFCLLLALAGSLRGTGHPSWLNIGLNLLLVQTWIPLALPAINLPSWSLSVEAAFYLLFPLLARFALRIPRRALPLCALCIWIASLAAPAIYDAWTLHDWGTPISTEFVQANPLVRLPEFVIGVLLGRHFLETVRAEGPQPGASHAWLAALALVVSWHFFGQHPTSMLESSLLAPLYAWLIYQLARGGGVLGSLLSTSFMKRLGEASYALYLIHYVFYFRFAALCKLLGILTGSPNGFFFAYLLASIAASLLIYRLIEEPARMAIKRWFRPRQLLLTPARGGSSNP
jgi:peptidoglycan/LPS O-acetylase OafA/YrhL